ncbi:ead/Ea22-like family protein [Enterobacter hormaechei]|nr:ead/Ea22-like family protein [Enterobacter hormaechei]
MSNIDKRALREIAEAAVGAHERLSVMPPDDIFDISLAEGTQLDADITALNALNSAANPATVLALLDELEAKDRRIEEEIARANREHHRGFMMACGHLKEHSNVHYADAAEMEIAALRNRINELESAAAGKGE